MILVVALCVRSGRADIALSVAWHERHCVSNLQGGLDPRKSVVAVASDATNNLPVMAVINSTISNARHPELVSFVIITRWVRRLTSTLFDHFPTYELTVCGGFSELLMQRPALSKLMTLHNSTRIKRKELLSPFNFAAFYLPYVLHDSRRVLYLDTDVVVKSDVGELHGLDMGGAPAAAVEDCSQKLHKYIDFELLSKLERNEHQAWTRWGLADSISEMSCVFNRGVVLFDCTRWRELRLTETIEDLVDAFVQSKARLWHGGISQPPFLLSLADRYLKLDLEWNVRGLGRTDIGRNEWLSLAEYARQRYGSEPGSFERHMAPSGPFKSTFNPYFCPFAAHAKILHFNGKLRCIFLSRSPPRRRAQAVDDLARRHRGLAPRRNQRLRRA